MDETLLNILHLIKTNLQTSSTEASQMIKTLDDTINESAIQELEIVSLKLETLLDRLKTELNNYFRLCSEPAPDDISEITTIQLEAEIILCELKVKIKNKTKVVECEKNKDTNRNVCSRLPKLDLPTFEGNILNWSTFWDQFESNIDNRNLTNVDKLLYLKASLKGEAKNVIEGLETNNKNYSIAISILKNRYGKENHIIDAHYAALYRIKPAHGTDVSELRSTFNEVERHLRVLGSLGENTSQNHLRFMIMQKFPKDIIYEIKMKVTTESIEEIRSCLEKIISAREDASRVAQGNIEETYTTQSLYVNTHDNYRKGDRKVINNYRERIIRKPEHRYSNKPRIPFQTQRGDTEPQFKRKIDSQDRNKERKYSKKVRTQCIFCGKDHYSSRCRIFQTMDERKRQLKGRCYGCFVRGHRISGCKKELICADCQKVGEHNRALCPKNCLHDKEPTMVQ